MPANKGRIFSESKYKHDWSPYHGRFFRLMASNLGTTLTEVRNIKKKLERPGKYKKKTALEQTLQIKKSDS